MIWSLRKGKELRAISALQRRVPRGPQMWCSGDGSSEIPLFLPAMLTDVLHFNDMCSSRTTTFPFSLCLFDVAVYAMSLFETYENDAFLKHPRNVSRVQHPTRWWALPHTVKQWEVNEIPSLLTQHPTNEKTQITALSIASTSVTRTVSPPPTENGSKKTIHTGKDILPVLNHRGIMKIDHFGKQDIRWIYREVGFWYRHFL